MELWNCDNGCDFVGGPGDFFQMSNPEDTHSMLVCGKCVYDQHLEDWSVDLEADPRYTPYSLVGDDSTLTMINGVVIASSRRVTI